MDILLSGNKLRRVNGEQYHQDYVTCVGLLPHQRNRSGMVNWCESERHMTSEWRFDRMYRANIVYVTSTLFVYSSMLDALITA